MTPLRILWFSLLGLLLGGGAAVAQPSPGWRTQADGLVIFQDDADLNGGGSFSQSRAFVRVGSIYTFGTGTSVGVSARLGEIDYDFGATAIQPWTDIRDYRLSIPVRIPVGERASLFVSPQVRWDYERGAGSSDGRTHGAFAGVAWRVSDQLTIGPAFGAFTQLKDSGVDVFPALLIDWDISDRWSVRTGAGLGATTGPGLTLSYAYSDALSFALAARYEELEFRLDNTGAAPGGVGEDRSVPVVLSLDYAPNPATSLSVFAGAELDGALRAYDRTGRRITSQTYDTAPIAGFAFRLRF